MRIMWALRFSHKMTCCKHYRDSVTNAWVPRATHVKLASVKYLNSCISYASFHLFSMLGWFWATRAFSVIGVCTSDPRTWKLAALTIDPTRSWFLPRSTAIGWLNEEDTMSSRHLWWGPPAPTFWDQVCTTAFKFGIPVDDCWFP